MTKENKEESYFDKLKHNILSVEDSETWKEKIEEFYRYLRGIDKPENIVNMFKPKLSHEAATTIIWFLQVQTGIIPDQFEFCDDCKNVYDSHRAGYWSDILGKGFCDWHRDHNLFFCEDCGVEVTEKAYSKRYSRTYEIYLCKKCRKERKGKNND